MEMRLCKNRIMKNIIEWHLNIKSDSGSLHILAQICSWNPPTYPITEESSCCMFTMCQAHIWVLDNTWYVMKMKKSTLWPFRSPILRNWHSTVQEPVPTRTIGWGTQLDSPLCFQHSVLLKLGAQALFYLKWKEKASAMGHTQ